MPNRWDEARQAWVDDLGHQWDPTYQDWGPLTPIGSGGGGGGGTSVIPKSTYTGGGSSGGGGGGVGQVSIGNQNRLDEAYIQDLAFKAKLAQQEFDSNSAYRSDTLGLQKQQLSQSAARDAQAHEEFLAKIGLDRESLQFQFQVESARLGLQQAELNLREREAMANNALQLAGFDLSQEQFDASQKQAQVGAFLETLKLLQNRKGPQDWTAYDYVTDGQVAPDPTKVTFLDPMKVIADSYVKSKVQRPAAMTAGGGSAPIQLQAPNFNAGGGGGGGGMSGGGGASMGGGGGGSQQFGGAGGGAWKDEKNRNVNPAGLAGSLVSQQPNPVANWAANWELPGGDTRTLTNPNPGYNTGTATQPNVTTDKSGNVWFDDGSPGGYWEDRWGQKSRDGGVTWMNQGGVTPGAAIVGDKPGKRTGAEEIAYAATNPETGRAELVVIPHELTAKILDRQMKRHGGRVVSASKMPKGWLDSLPRAAEGGIFGEEPYQMPGGTATQGGDPFKYEPFGGYARNNQQLVAESGWKDQGIRRKGGAGYSIMGNAQPAGGMQGAMGAAGGNTVYPGGGGAPLVSPGTGGSGAGTQPQGEQPRVAWEGPGSVAPLLETTGTFAPIGPNDVVNNTVLGSEQAAAGGSTPGAIDSFLEQQGAIPRTPDPQELGPGKFDPYRIRVTKYSGDAYNNTPVLQMIRGQRPAYGFRGYAINPSIPSMGIDNLPTNLSMQILARMNPNRLKMLQGVYDNPEAGTSWDDISDMATRAAPLVSRGFSMARAR